MLTRRRIGFNLASFLRIAGAVLLSILVLLGQQPDYFAELLIHFCLKLVKLGLLDLL